MFALVTFQELNKCGIQNSDARLEHMMQMLNNLRPHSVRIQDLKLDAQVFKTVLSENIVLINRVLDNSFTIPAFDTFCEHITRIYEKVLNLLLFHYTVSGLLIRYLRRDWPFGL